MKEHAMTENELKALFSLLDDDFEIFTHIKAKIMSLGTTIIPKLEKEWENSFNPIKQKRIEDIIHNLQFELIKEKLTEWYHSEDQDLLEGMFIIATYQYPDLKLEDLKKKLEQIYFDVWVKMEEEIHPLDKVKRLNHVIFNSLKFTANSKNFHAPNNSMINIVLESRKGNPISLCVIYLLIAKKMNLPIHGVNLPKLFVLSYEHELNQFYINVFNRGLIFSKEDIDNYLYQLKIEKDERFYKPCSNLEIIQRVIRNLIYSFEKLGDLDNVTELRELLLILE